MLRRAIVSDCPTFTVLAKELQERKELFYYFVIVMIITAILFEVFNIYYSVLKL